LPRRIAIHGHFYQPPRENPWTGRVERQPSAAPDHDWNIRIARECYLPNLSLGNLSYLSFNFGPTLLSWADVALPELSRGVVTNDRAARDHGRRGPAIAQLFSHPIAPLLSERDRRTQVRWGILDFTNRFGRKPEGMWLPECAADVPTLRTLVEEGIQFTILSPSQAKRFRDGGGAWQNVTDRGMDTSEPARVDVGGGKYITVFFYDRNVSESISFGETLTSPARLVDVLKRAALARQDGSLLFVATDGETFGHHKKGGDQGLHGAIELLKNDADVRFVNIADLAAEGAPSRIVEIHEPSAWSCAHGVERWRSDCGCRLASGMQQWRTALRAAIEQLTIRIHQIFERDGSEVFNDPWNARDRSAGADPTIVKNQEWFLQLLRRPDSELHQKRALRLLEMERQLLFAHTSCAWFFDDIGGIEPIQNLRHAARAIELSRGGAPLEDELIGFLRGAKSNDPRIGDGASVYRRFVLPGALDRYAVAARAAFYWLFLQKQEPRNIANYAATVSEFERHSQNRRTLATGIAKIEDPFDGPADHIAFAALSIGDGECFVYLASGNDRDRAAHASSEAHAAFRTGRLPECLQMLALRYTTRLVHSLDLEVDAREEIERVARENL